MSAINKHRIAFLAALILFLSARPLHALDDGFGPSKKIEGKSVVIYCAPETDIPNLIQKLNIRPSDTILAGQPLTGDASYGNELAGALDTLCEQVSGILDMRLYNLKINIYVCKDTAQLEGIYRHMFSEDLGGRQSFYVYGLNSVYVSEDSFKREIVGHEMAHAIISHYFVVPAPVKIQEILSMYVEYNLRRAEK